jgi:hypothetical protein
MIGGTAASRRIGATAVTRRSAAIALGKRAESMPHRRAHTNFPFVMCGHIPGFARVRKLLLSAYPELRIASAQLLDKRCIKIRCEGTSTTIFPGLTRRHRLR